MVNPKSTNRPLTDPFDVESLRSQALADISVEKVTLTVPVRRPNRMEFFRVHPDLDYTVDWAVLERNTEMDRETYWVTSEFRADLAGELKSVRVFTAINKHGTVFLWPAKLPGDSSIGRRWSDSALVIADHAKSSWVRMGGNRDLGAYEMYKARGDLGEPAWPDTPFNELLRTAFTGERLIDRPDHPVLREMAGEM